MSDFHALPTAPGLPSHTPRARHRSRAVSASSAFGLLLGLAALVHAAPPQTELSPPDTEAGGHLGASVAIDGDVAVVGATAADGGEGAVYVYERSGGTWTRRARLISSQRDVGFDFGAAVAVSGDTAFVSCWRDNGFAGAVYVFSRDGTGAWTERQRLIASDRGNNHRFGRALAASGTDLVVGAPGDDDAGSFSGSVYVFARGADGLWTERQKLTASDAAPSTAFGDAVAISDGVAVIGAPGAPVESTALGSAYVFAPDATGTWTERTTLVPADRAAGSRVGFAVALSGGTAVIGGPGNVPVHVFARSSGGVWEERQTLVASDSAIGDRYGMSVAVSGDTCLVAAAADDDDGPDSGSVYEYVRGADGVWAERQKLTAADAAADDAFGWSVAMDRDTAVVGAFLHDHPVQDGGAAYVFDLETDFGTEGALTGTARLKAKGLPVVRGAAAGSLTFGNGSWTLTDPSGPALQGTYVARGRSGRKLVLTLDERSMAAFLASLGRALTGGEGRPEVTVALRGRAKVVVQLDRSGTEVAFAATLPITATQDGVSRRRRGAFRMKLDGPLAAEE